MKKSGKKWKYLAAIYRLIVESIKLMGSLGTQWYFDWFSADYSYLVQLGSGKESELAWAYFLAQDLWEYRFYWWNQEKPQQALREIEIWLTLSCIEYSVRARARDYMVRLGLPIEQITLPEEVISGQRGREIFAPDILANLAEIPLGCGGCIHLHGQYYSGKLLVCAMHPSGKANCEDYQA